MKIEKSEIISFFRNIIGIKDKYALEQLGIHSRKWTLKANTVYYFHVSLHSGWMENSTGTLKITPAN